MRIYARIQDERVVEILTTDCDISTMFHPALVWIDASSAIGIEEGWTYDGSIFSRAITPEVSPPVLSIPEIQAQLNTLTAQLALLSKSA